jgi:ankyrin repeat protein
MPRSRLGRAVFVGLVVVLLAFIWSNVHRRQLREAPSRFYNAALSGDVAEMASLLSNHLVHLNQPPWATPPQGYRYIRSLGEEALVGAVRNPGGKTVGSVQFLVDHGVDVNTRAEDGVSVTNEALRYGHPEYAKLLIERGANVHADDHIGSDPPLVSASSDSDNRAETLEVARLLLARGVDVNAANSNGTTPLLWASKNGNWRLVYLLLNHSAAINARDHYGQTALTLAVESGQVAVVKILLDHQADPSLGRGRYGTPLQTARTKKNSEILRLLSQAGRRH